MSELCYNYVRKRKEVVNMKYESNNIYVTPEYVGLWKQLKTNAKKLKISLSELVNRLLKQIMEEK